MDFKSLTGDTADNIRGVDGVGPKTASKLISQFGDLNNLMENYQSIESQRLRERIEGTLERLKLNRTLIQMDCNQELPYQMEDLEFTSKIPKTRAVLGEIGLL